MLKSFCAFSLIGLLGLAACTETPEARAERERNAVAEAEEFFKLGKFEEANSKLGQVTATPAVAELKEKVAAALKKAEIERVSKETVDKAAALNDTIADLSAADVSSLEGVRAALDAFEKGAVFLASNPVDTLDEQGRQACASLKSVLSKSQVALFPVMRKTYGKEIDRTLWESDVEVRTSGTGNRQISFIGGMFAANRNIASAQEAASPMLTKLRFSRAKYHWYEGSEYTYYDLKPEPDAAIPDFRVKQSP